MSFKGYTLENVDTQLVVKLNSEDRLSGKFDLISTNESSPSKLNEQWRLIPLSSDSGDLYTIQSVSSNSYAGNIKEIVHKSPVQSSSAGSVWSVVPDEDGQVVIKVPSSNLVWTFESNGPDTKVTLSPFNAANPGGQTWKVKTIL